MSTAVKFILNLLPVILKLRETVDIHLTNPIELVGGRPTLYGRLLDPKGNPITFSNDDGKEFVRDITVFLPGKFNGTEEFLEAVHDLNKDEVNNEEGFIKLSALRRGTKVRVKLIFGKMMIKGVGRITVPTVRALAIVGREELPEVEVKKEEPSKDKGVSRASIRRPAPSMRKRVSK